MKNKAIGKLQTCSCIFFVVGLLGFGGFLFVSLFSFVLGFCCCCCVKQTTWFYQRIIFPTKLSPNLPKHNGYQICTSTFFICKTSDTHRMCLTINFICKVELIIDMNS